MSINHFHPCAKVRGENPNALRPRSQSNVCQLLLEILGREVLPNRPAPDPPSTSDSLAVRLPYFKLKLKFKLELKLEVKLKLTFKLELEVEVKLKLTFNLELNLEVKLKLKFKLELKLEVKLRRICKPRKKHFFISYYYNFYIFLRCIRIYYGVQNVCRY
ncbi:unnamed protein product, partial [Nesidiocoris tenuis]